jgi:hypothetical protein
VADHSLLIGIGDRDSSRAWPRRLFDSRLHLLSEISRKFHTANVDRKIEIGVAQKYSENAAKAKKAMSQLSWNLTD